MGAHPHDSTEGPAGSRLGSDLAAHVEAIVHAAEREARAAERAIADRRRSAEEEVRRYLAAARLHVDAEAAARAARLETLSASARRLAEELSDAVAALRDDLRRDVDDDAAMLPRAPWPPAERATAEAPPVPAAPPPPAAEPAPTPAAAAPPPAEPTPAAPEPVWSRAAEPRATEAAASEPVVEETLVPSAARLVAIEMAVGGSSRAEVEEHLRVRLGVGDADALLDDVFGAASHAGSRLAWGEP